jgi:hypothetical protein
VGDRLLGADFEAGLFECFVAEQQLQLIVAGGLLNFALALVTAESHFGSLHSDLLVRINFLA